MPMGSKQDGRCLIILLFTNNESLTKIASLPVYKIRKKRWGGSFYNMFFYHTSFDFTGHMNENGFYPHDGNWLFLREEIAGSFIIRTIIGC